MHASFIFYFYSSPTCLLIIFVHPPPPPTLPPPPPLHMLFVCSVGPLRRKHLLTTLSSVPQLWSRLPSISSRSYTRPSYFKWSFDLICCLLVVASQSISYRAYLIIKFICSWRLRPLLPSSEVLMGYLSSSFKAKCCQCQFSPPIICPSSQFSFKELGWEGLDRAKKKSYYKVFKCRQSVLCSGCREQHRPN